MMKVLMDVPAALLLLVQQAPSSDVFVTNVTNQDVPVIVRDDAGGTTERTIASRELADIPCRGGAVVLVNNNGRVDSWRVICGRRYALQVAADRTAFEITEVASR
jgi:hypothetical protein